MKSVWKFKITAGRIIELRMPDGAEPILVEKQCDEAYLWAVVDTEVPTVDRKFAIFATGEEMVCPPGHKIGRHVGTWMMLSDYLVWHLFEVVPFEDLPCILLG